jgi:hypothetical protein
MSLRIVLILLDIPTCPSDVLTILHNHAADLCSGVTDPFYAEFRTYTQCLWDTPLPNEIVVKYPHLKHVGDFATTDFYMPRDYWGHIRYTILRVCKTIQAMNHCLNLLKTTATCKRCFSEACTVENMETPNIRFIRCLTCEKTWAEMYT